MLLEEIRERGISLTHTINMEWPGGRLAFEEAMDFVERELQHRFGDLRHDGVCVICEFRKRFAEVLGLKPRVAFLPK